MKRRAPAHAVGAKSKIMAVVLLLGPAWPCTAAEWSVEPGINMMYENNDNRSLTTARHKTTTGYVADVFLPFAVRSPASEISLTPRIRSQRYDDSRLDSDDYYLNLQSGLDTPRTRWQLDAARSWASTLTTEFQDVGLVDVYRPRNGSSLYPSVSHNLT